MPHIYMSPVCTLCLSGANASILHKYTQCHRVNDAWFTLRQILENIDPLLLFESDHSLINFYFTNLFREEPIIWLIGEFTSYLEHEVFLNNRMATGKGLLGYLDARRSSCGLMSIPPIGSIPEIDQIGVG